MKPACNIELKARLHDLPAARLVAQCVATEYLGTLLQTDTYFHCPQGRMKLREIIDLGCGPGSTVDLPINEIFRSEKIEGFPHTAQLIWYERPDRTSAKGSEYQISEIKNPKRIRQLKAEMGIHVIVEKRREVYLHHNVRIHLDEVANLGTFLEFEAVLGQRVDPLAGHAQVSKLQREFGIPQTDLVRGSYADLLSSQLSGKL